MTTTTDPTLTALYAAICANLGDDTARLVYADALDEQDSVSVPCPQCKASGSHVLDPYALAQRFGTHRAGLILDAGKCGVCSGHGTIPDTANRDRAEFIRIGIELARMPPKPRELCVVGGAGTRLEGLGVDLIHEGDGHYTASTGERGLSTETFTPGERVDIYANRAGKGIKWMRGLRYVKRVPEREIIVFRRDGDSKPWVGTELLARESALLATYRERWLRVDCPKCKGRKILPSPAKGSTRMMCPACAGSGDIGGLTERKFLDSPEDGLSPIDLRQPAEVTWRRGFPHEVRGVRLADVFEQAECDRVNDEFRWQWQPTPWLLRVLRWHPTVERVPLADKSPTTWSDTPAMWERDMTDTSLGTTASYICGETSRIPGFIFDVMEGEPGGYYFMLRKHGDKRHTTRELADDALATAVVRVGREWLAKEDQP